MKKLYLLPFILFEKIKKTKINIIITLAIGFLVGAVYELIIMLINSKDIMAFLQNALANFKKNNLNLLLLYLFSASFFTVTTIILRILVGFLCLLVLEKKVTNIKGITEIVCYSYFVCFFGLIPYLGIFIEYILSVLFLYSGFKIVMETKDWKSIIAAVLISIVSLGRIQPFFYVL